VQQPRSILAKPVDPALAHVRIVLVAPAGPLNVGSVARVMANMGLRRLVLVNPQCDPLDEAARQMAVHAADILTQAQVVTTLPEALVGCRRAIATTARPRTLDAPLELPEVALPWVLGDERGDAAIVFGPEDRGLSNEELNYAQRFVGIPSHPAYPSLNLAQAVAVCTYELRRAAQGRSSSAAASPLPGAGVSASMDQMEGFYQQLEGLLLKIGYLYPHTAGSRMEKFRRFFYRAAPTEQELAMLRGILSQMGWALGNAPTEAPSGETFSESDPFG
jgi:tRNA/rRNA methyltransferase